MTRKQQVKHAIELRYWCRVTVPMRMKNGHYNDPAWKPGAKEMK